VAEDSEFNSRHLERLLGRRGHAVRVANDGRAALDLVGDGAFDLLLLDVHMPELDGFQVVRAIRERERAGGHLPVIALTARAEGRPRALPRGRHGRLPLEAGPGRRIIRGHRPGCRRPRHSRADPGG
jgi:CheY-like chemotaxis protein